MEVILLEKVPNLGNLGDKVIVKPGYGRNYLIPQGKAVRATAEKLAEFEQRRAELEGKAASDLAAAQVRAEAISSLVVTIAQRAGEEGRLYGSIGAKDIAEATTKAGVPLHKHEVHLPTGPIRHTGDFTVSIRVHSDVTVSLALRVVPE